MENPTLHTQKVAILSRLIKESSLTLEEALLLLKEEEEVVQESVQNPVQQQGWHGHPYTITTPLTGSGTITVPNGFFTTSGTGNITTTTAFLNTPSTPTADLNN